MPRPIYIICSQFGSIDQQTGFVSLFNVIEKFQITKRKNGQRQPKGVQIPAVSMRAVAVWMQNATDNPDWEFEYELLVFLPSNRKKSVAGTGRFKFSKPLHRFTIDIVGMPPFKGSGIMTVQSRIRRVGERKWLKQEYPIIVEEVISMKN